MVQKPGGGYIDDLPETAEGSGYYELDATRDEYLAFHYPDGDPLASLLGERTPPLEDRYPFGVRKLWHARPEGDALDVGGAVGRVTFDLARDHRHAYGFDFSKTLVRGAYDVARHGRAVYTTVIEGDLRARHDVAVATPPNVSFVVANALAIPFPEAHFATVVALNLVDRVPDPLRLLAELTRVTAPGGTLLVGSPFTWLATFTPRAKWLGGREEEGQPMRGAATLRAELAAAFEFKSECRVPFYIPHHDRSGQFGVSHVQHFVRR